jgi:hypothetical protein
MITLTLMITTPIVNVYIIKTLEYLKALKPLDLKSSTKITLSIAVLQQLLS